MKRIHDISMSLESDMVTWPGSVPFSLEPVKRIADGFSSNTSLLRIGTHCGTHIDAPSHFIDGKPGVDSIDPEILIGNVKVFQLPDVEHITRASLEKLDLNGASRVLFGTRNSDILDQPYTSGYVAVSKDAAEYLVDHKIKLVGIDYLSIEEYRCPGYPTHNALLGAGIVVVEGLDLRGIPDGEYELICLPIKIRNADGAPARVMLRDI